MTEAAWLAGSAWLVVATLMFVLWVVHLVLRNAAIVDAGWAAGVALSAIVYAMLGDGDPLRRWVFAAMAAIWGGRLAVYLFLTRVYRQPEEGRYVDLRKRWGGNLTFKFLLFFQFQAVIAVVLSMPFLAAALDGRAGLGWFEYAGLALWLVAFTGESLADWQLHQFKLDPANRGRVCQLGLWRYSRHPNYFFEWLIWVAYAVFALASPWGWVSLLAPALMLYFLFRVTGIPATEAQALRSRPQAYRRYQETTSAFVPWSPRRG